MTVRRSSASSRASRWSISSCRSLGTSLTVWPCHVANTPCHDWRSPLALRRPRTATRRPCHTRGGGWTASSARDTSSTFNLHLTERELDEGYPPPTPFASMTWLGRPNCARSGSRGPVREGHSPQTPRSGSNRPWCTQCWSKGFVPTPSTADHLACLTTESLSGGAGIRTPVQRLLSEHSPSAANRRLSGSSLLPAPMTFRS